MIKYTSDVCVVSRKRPASSPPASPLIPWQVPPQGMRGRGSRVGAERSRGVLTRRVDQDGITRTAATRRARRPHARPRCVCPRAGRRTRTHRDRGTSPGSLGVGVRTWARARVWAIGLGCGIRRIRARMRARMLATRARVWIRSRYGPGSWRRLI